MPKVEVSFGELADKWTILKIKETYLTEPNQQANIKSEIDVLTPSMAAVESSKECQSVLADLENTNRRIWILMDQVYALKEPNYEYAKLSLEIIYENQQRAYQKKQIDALLKSTFHEEKSYFSDATQVIDGNLYKGQ